MKREIKFRAWDESFGTMVYDIDPDHYEVYFNGNQLTCRSIDGNGDPFTLPLLQFTGLKDRNGKEIYEGDIFSYRGDIKVIDDIAAFYWANFEGLLDNKYIWVLGNIYENSDLLKA